MWFAEHPGPVQWDAVVLTCFKKKWVETLQKELDIRMAKGYLGKDVIHLVVEDPKSNVGSGGATLNALLTVVEYMSARRGFTAINADVLQGSKILILHTKDGHGQIEGLSFTYESTRTFVNLPAVRDDPTFDGPVCNFDLLYSIITEKIAGFAKPGVWVSSTDQLISLPEQLDLTGAFSGADVCAISIPQSPKLLKEHGFYKLDEMGFVEDIFFQADSSIMDAHKREDGMLLGVAGILYMTHVVSEKLLAFHTKPPLDACTYMGQDSGQPPLKLSLFFDFLLPMTSVVSEEDFIRGSRSATYGKPASEQPKDSRHNMEYARTMLWRDLHNFKMKACLIEGAKYAYMTQTATDHKTNLFLCPQTPGLGYTWTKMAHVEVEPSVSVHDESALINSVLCGDVSVGSRCIVSHSDLVGKVKIGKDCLITAVRWDCSKTDLREIRFLDSMVVQGYNIHLKSLNRSQYIITGHGKMDDIMAPTWKSKSTFCNQPWLMLCSRTGIDREELWPAGTDNDNQTIYNAKLFPLFHVSQEVGITETLWLMGTLEDDTDQTILKRWRESWRVSISDILTYLDIEAEFQWRRDLFFKVGIISLERTLKTQGNKGFCCLHNSASVEGYTEELLQTLDKIASETSSPGIAARTLANVADMLGGMAGTGGGLRSGPAGNVSWKRAFTLLEKGEFKAGVEALAFERKKWMARPDLLIRAARHYEGAAQILIRQAVMTAKEFFSVEPGTLPLMNKWVQADCPARIDISGGWSDTPPITYEHGGAVTMVGLLINGKRPIGAKARRIPEPVIRLVLVNQSASNTEVECSNLSDLLDYCQPHAPGALLKAAFVCVDLVDLKSKDSLKHQLMDNFGCGFELQSWSNLPHGSGMGTSSILAGAVLAALLGAAGKKVDNTGLIHAVLYLEQLLTTGGGWQDQIGGLVGGVRLGLSEAKLPLKVEVVDLKISPEYIQRFNDRLVLIYTGKTRLARNLLQEVVRNWYARNPHIVSTEDALVRLAKECSTGFIDGDLETVGRCVARYWEMKKRVAPGCESATIATIMTALKPYVYGMCSAGAGGGGFIYGIMKEPKCQSFVKEILDQQEGIDAVIYEAEIDDNGVTVTYEE